MSTNPYVDAVVAAFASNRDAGRADRMAAYMRNQFPFCGLPSPARTALQRQAWSPLAPLSEDDLVATVSELWALPEREYQYAALALLDRYAKRGGPGLMATAEALIVDKSWWDTVDELATHVVAGLVSRFPELRREIARFIESDNLWLARTAIIFQVGYKAGTDADLLFGNCLRRVDEGDFFIRKAIGWALREYSKTDPAAVRGFVAAHAGELSGLSRREALRLLDRRAPRSQP